LGHYPYPSKWHFKEKGYYHPTRGENEISRRVAVEGNRLFLGATSFCTIYIRRDFAHQKEESHDWFCASESSAIFLVTLNVISTAV
jgi:hypothetical protein